MREEDGEGEGKAAWAIIIMDGMKKKEGSGGGVMASIPHLYGIGVKWCLRQTVG